MLRVLVIIGRASLPAVACPLVMMSVLRIVLLLRLGLFMPASMLLSPATVIMLTSALIFRMMMALIVICAMLVLSGTEVSAA